MREADRIELDALRVDVQRQKAEIARLTAERDALREELRKVSETRDDVASVARAWRKDRRLQGIREGLEWAAREVDAPDCQWIRDKDPEQIAAEADKEAGDGA